MASLWNLADTYERWASEDETFAAEILESLKDSADDDSRHTLAQRALVLIHQAEGFRKSAANLRFAHPGIMTSRLRPQSDAMQLP
jgi:hypothetical protein